MKVVIIGGVAEATAAARLRRLDERARSSSWSARATCPTPTAPVYYVGVVLITDRRS